MKVTFLGTGAAGWPADLARFGDARGLNRRHTSLLVGSTLLIDPNPDVPEALSTFGLDAQAITHVLVSHSHDDHYCAATLEYLAGFHPIEVYGDPGIRGKIPACPDVHFHPLTIGTPVTLPQGVITPLLSTHCVEDTDESCLHYILELDGRNLFYGCDGAWFTAETWYKLGTHRYDLMVLDASFGDDPMKLPFKSYGVRFFHNTPEMLKTMLAAMYTTKAADKNTIIVADHLSPYYFPNIEACRETYDPLGMVSAYDGMVVEL